RRRPRGSGAVPHPRCSIHPASPEGCPVMTLAELATRLGCQLEGDGSLQVWRLAGIEQAVAGEVTFLANPKYASKLGATRASAVIADASVKHAPCAILRTPEPYLAFAAAVAVLTPAARPAAGIHP